MNWTQQQLRNVKPLYCKIISKSKPASLVKRLVEFDGQMTYAVALDAFNSPYAILLVVYNRDEVLYCRLLPKRKAFDAFKDLKRQLCKVTLQRQLAYMSLTDAPHPHYAQQLPHLVLNNAENFIPFVLSNYMPNIQPESHLFL